VTVACPALGSPEIEPVSPERVSEGARLVLPRWWPYPKRMPGRSLVASRPGDRQLDPVRLPGRHDPSGPRPLVRAMRNDRLHGSVVPAQARLATRRQVNITGRPGAGLPLVGDMDPARAHRVHRPAHRHHDGRPGRRPRVSCRPAAGMAPRHRPPLPPARRRRPVVTWAARGRLCQNCLPGDRTPERGDW
jgi:hypothetical protein